MQKQSGLAVVLFPNTQTAIQAERLLQSEGIAGKLIPIPRQFGTDCGLALRIPQRDRERVRAALERAGIRYRAIYEV